MAMVDIFHIQLVIIKEQYVPFFDKKVTFYFVIMIKGDIMKVKVFDENHEADLEKSINVFISEEEPEIFDIKFSVSSSIFGEEQVFCFSALILYR